MGLIAAQQGVKGDITDLKVADPAATRKAFDFEFNLEQSGFLDWSQKKQTLELPFLKLDLPQEADEDSTEPIKLGGPSEYVSRLRLELPATLKARLPVPISIGRDYGEYSSTYRLEGNTLIAERKLILKQRELAAVRASDYAAFRRAADQDANQKLVLDNPSPGAPQLPESAKAEELFEAGNHALDGEQYSAAVELFKRTVSLDPMHKSAWNNLGRAYLALGQNEKAVEACRKQIEINPFDQWSYNNLGRGLQRLHKYEESIAAYRKQIEINPLDQYSHVNLGGLFLDRKRWEEAVAEFEKAAGITPENPDLHAQLGLAYLKSGQNDKAFATFDRAVELSPTAPMWNNVAYQLCENRAGLDRARQYAESSVAATSAILRNLTVNSIDSPQASMGSLLAASWDTLGWVRFQEGDVEGAEKLVRAAWHLQEHGEVADHLGQIYEKRGEQKKAMEAYAMALATINPPEETRSRLVRLAGGDNQANALIHSAREKLSAGRTVPMGKLLKEDVSADFAVLLSPGPTVDGARFVGGSEKLKPFAEKLRALDYGVSFPDNTPAKVVISGKVLCLAFSGECSFVRNPEAGSARQGAISQQ
jgi:tetratricopeptide (TPR) repeat protein